jgi:hypothetical protein
MQDNDKGQCSPGNCGPDPSAAGPRATVALIAKAATIRRGIDATDLNKTGTLLMCPLYELLDRLPVPLTKTYIRVESTALLTIIRAGISNVDMSRSRIFFSATCLSLI